MAVRYAAVSAFVPCSVALFTCECGASAVEFDMRLEVPHGWSTRETPHLCPRCSGDEVGGPSTEAGEPSPAQPIGLESQAREAETANLAPGGSTGHVAR